MRKRTITAVWMHRMLAVVLAVVLVVGAIGTVAPPGAGVASASHGGTHVDDFEDGDISIGTSGWSGWTGATGSFAAVSSDPITGSYSGELSSSNANNAVEASADSSITPSRIAARVRISNDVSTTGDRIVFRVQSGTTTVVTIEFQTDDNRVDVGGSPSTFEWREGATYAVEITDIDFGANTFDVQIDNETISDDASFSNAASGVNNIDFISVTTNSAGTMNLFVDDLQTNGSEFTFSPATDATLDDFEDEDLGTATADGWNGWTGATDSLSTTSDALNDSFSGNLTSNDADKHVQMVSESGDHSPSRIAWTWSTNNQTASVNNAIEMEVYDGTVELIEFQFRDDGSIRASNGSTTIEDTGESWSTSTAYNIELTNINWSNGTYNIEVNGTTIETAWSFRTDSSRDGFDILVFSSKTDAATSQKRETARIDNIEVGNPTTKSSSESDDDTYLQTVELDSETSTIQPQTSDLTAYYIETSDGTRAQTHEEVSSALDDGGFWLEEDTDEFDFQNTSTVRLHDGAVYDLRVYDSANEGFYAETFDAEADIWEDETLVFHVESPDSIISCENYLGDGECDPDDPASSGGPFGSSGGDTFTWYDPTGTTTDFNYTVTFPDGSTYTFNESFDEPLSYFEGNLSGFEQEPVEVSWAADSNGSTYAGTFDWGEGGLSGGGGLGVPLGGSGGGGGGGVAGAPWWVWAVLLGGAGYFARDELGQAVQNTTPAVRRAASRTAGSVASGARGAARAARRIIQR